MLQKLSAIASSGVFGSCGGASAGYSTIQDSRVADDLIFKREEDIDLYEQSIRSRHESGRYWSEVFTLKELYAFVDARVHKAQSEVLTSLLPRAFRLCMPVSR